MKYISSFYESFYGFDFVRHFRRPSDLDNPKVKTQFIVKNPKNLYLYVHKNSGFHPCYTHIYDHGSIDNLNGQDKNRIIYDRAFFDFDVTNLETKSIKHILQHLRRKNINETKHLQEKLKNRLRELIIDNRIAKTAIDDAKRFSIEFERSFGSKPALFFSGCKGCHAYTFFEPCNFNNLDGALSWFAKNLKTEYPTLDLSVTKDATARLSRVPYSQHQYTGLTVVPFTCEDRYGDIMNKALNPVVEPFNQSHFISDFNLHLQKIDENLQIIEFRDSIKRTADPPNLSRGANRKVKDHRTFFKDLLGEPEKEYPEKEYVMYKCPFKDHEDNKPSFRVHKTGYYCYGCERKGNYWQFLKDYNNWDDEEVKGYLGS